MPDSRALQPVRVGGEGAVVTGAEVGSGAPLLLLHGLGGTWQYSGRSMELLAGRARCIALDLPGFGKSDATPEGFALDSAADRMAMALDALGAAPAVVCGHSLGGPLAVRLALRHPDAVSRVILVGPSGLGPAPAWQHRALRILPASYSLLRRAPFRWDRWVASVAPLRRAGLALLVDNTAAVDPDVVRSLVDGARDARELRAAFAASLEAGLGEEAALVSAPIAAIWGERDRMVPPSDAELLRREVPTAAIHFLPACGHLPMVERPEAFAALLAKVGLE